MTYNAGRTSVDSFVRRGQRAYAGCDDELSVALAQRPKPSTGLSDIARLAVCRNRRATRLAFGGEEHGI